MKRLICIQIILVSIFGCASFPKMSRFVTERKNTENIDFSKNGLIAYTYKSNARNSSISVDMKNLNSNKVYRVEINKPFSNEITVVGFKVLENLASKDIISDSIAIFELPEGTYLPIRNIYYKNQNEQGSQSATGKKFIVTKGKITSLGEIEIDFFRELFKKPYMKINSNLKSISEAIRGVDNEKIKNLEILEQSFSSNAE